MYFRELSYILALAKHGTIVQAAKELYITQPSLTKFLQKTQAELGVQLFERVGRRYKPTLAGERYIETAQHILSLKTQLDNEMQEFAKYGHGRLSVAFPLTRGSYILPAVLPRFREAYPNVEVIVQEADSGKIQEMLRAGEIDLAIMSAYNIDERLCAERIAREEYVMILRKGHPLAKLAKTGGNTRYPWVDLKDFSEEKVIMLESSQRSKSLIERILRENGVSPEVAMTLKNQTTLINMVNAGFGYGFSSDSHVRALPEEHRPDCFSLGKNGFSFDCIAAYRNTGYHPQYEKDFIAMVREFYQTKLWPEENDCGE
ncbi:MAG: LysR family transcriptional regulator [Clostridia bacterium]|nr:LysR family transcriptional regulator [Clostridia bacterium]